MMNRIRDVIERLVIDGRVEARSNGSIHDIFPIAVPPEIGSALGTWVRAEKATRTIEIGLAYGMSALHICDALLSVGYPDARHAAIDPCQTTRCNGAGFASCGLQVLEDAGVLNMVEHFEEESQIALPRLLAEGRVFDLAFIDGNHRFDRVFLDLYYLGRLVRRGGLIILDDYDLPGVARAASFFRTNLGWELEHAPDPSAGHRLVALRTSLADDNRPFTYFKDF